MAVQHPTFEGFPRLMARYGEDQQVFELFRCEKGRTLSRQEITARTAHLSPGWTWWVAYATSAQALMGPRPCLTQYIGRPLHRGRARMALSRTEIQVLTREGIITPNPEFNPPIPRNPANAPAANQPPFQIRLTQASA